MKKIILLLTLFIIISCGKNEEIQIVKQIETPIKEEIKKENMVEEIINEEIPNNEVPTIKPINEINSSASLSNFLENLNNLKDNYKNDKEFVACIEDNYNSCYSMVVSKNSIEKNDINICNDFSTEFSKKECKKIFILDNAIKKLDINECNNIQDDEYYKINCKSEIAMLLIEKDNNLEHCNDIYTKNNTVWNEESYNEEIIEETINRCINNWAYSIAVKTKDINDCLKMKDKYQIDICIEDVNTMKKYMEEWEQEKITNKLEKKN